MKRHLIIIVACLLAMPLHAQRVTKSFYNVSLSEALLQLSRQTSEYTIYFLYNDLEDFRVTTTISHKPLPDAIQQTIGFYPVSMTIDASDPKEKKIFVECSQKTTRRYKGRVVDDKGQPIEFANVALLSPKDSSMINGGVTNESGYFVIPCESEKVIAKVSFVGYQTFERPYSSPSMGVIRLVTDHIALRGVTVKTQRPQYKMAKGGMTIDVENTVLSKMGNGFDVLSQLPRVSVDGQKVSVFAKGTPLVYINNKKVTSATELSELKSEDIKNIDVITSPGAQYDATVQSVIRIRTRRPVGEGFSATNIANAAYNTMWGGQEYLQLKYRTGGLELSSGTGLFSQVSKEDDKVDYTLRPAGDIIHIAQHANVNSRENVLSQTVRASYDFNADNSVGGSYRYYKTLSNYAVLEGSQQVARNGLDLGNIIQDQHMTRYVGPRQEANAYYIGKLGDWHIDFNGSYVHMKYTEGLNATETSETLESRDVRNNGGQKSDMWAGKLVITHPMGKGEWSFGSEYTHTKSEGFYTNEQNYVPSSQTLLKETNVAAFADFAMPFGHYSLSAGLRYEHVKTDYFSFGEWEKEPSRRYGNFFPNVSLSWNKGMWAWQASYAMKTQRPSYRNLRNYMQYDSRYLYEGGNPYLRPEYYHNIELSVIYKWLSISADYIYTHKPMVGSFDLYNGQEIAYMSQHNAGHEQGVYASVVASPKFGWYQPMWEIDYAQRFYHEPTPLNSHQPTFGFNAHNRFALPHNWMAAIDFDGYTDYYRPMRRHKGYFTMSAQVRKSFLRNRLVFSLQASDLNNGNRENWTFYCVDVTSHKDASNFERQIKLTVTYNFNASRTRYKGTGAGNAEKSRL